VAAICVYCASSESIDPSYLRLAAEVGTELARRGHSLVSGGGRVSMMGAVADAVRAGGGYTVGVIPAALRGREVEDLDADLLVVTTTMRARKAEMDDRADAFLGLPGGIGTLEEIFEVWTSRSLGMHDKPVVLLDPDGFYRGLLDWLEGLRAAGFVRAGSFRALAVVDTVPAAMEALVTEVPEDPPVP
jgi:uncharacterized protein (TIGR00730 family)